MSEAALRKELLEVEKREEEMLRLLKRKPTEAQLLQKLRVFHFSDFGRTVVGTTIFSAPALFNASFWEFLDGLPDSLTYKIFVAHTFFLFCVFITLNYSYRTVFSWEPDYLKQLGHRMFLIYLTVFGTILLLLWSFNKITATITTLELLRTVFISVSIGLVGAVTFSFLAVRGDAYAQ